MMMQVAYKIGLPGMHLHEAVEDESVEGTGNLIWTAGVRLSQHLVKNRGGELKGARVLDLGSGTGELGLGDCDRVAACLCEHSLRFPPRLGVFVCTSTPV